MNKNANDHMANERTFLAWIRTSIGIMAFGFVIEKFALFTKQISLMLFKSGPSETLFKTPSHLVSTTHIGGWLVLMGVVICLLAFMQFITDQKRINTGNYQPSIWLNALLTLTIILIGIFLVFYLNNF